MTTATPAQRDDGDERVVVSASGVQVRKWLATDEAAVPVVRYELASARDDDVTVRVTDAVPSHLEPDDVGFHDAHHGDRWDRPGERAIRFETGLPAGEEVTTLYGVRRPEIEDEDAFLAEPEVAVAAESAATRASAAEAAPSAADEDVNERLRRALEDASAASDGDEGAVGDNGDGSHEATATDSAEGDDAGVNGSDTLSLDQPSDSAASTPRSGGAREGEAPTDDGADGPIWAGSSPAAAVDASDDELASAREAAGTSASSDASGESVDPTGPERASSDRDEGDAGASGSRTDEGVASALVTELEDGAVDAETRETLARELNLQLSASSSQFVEHLQSRMKEKRGQLESDIERLEDSIAELYGLKADSAEVSSVREEKADVDAVAAVEERLEALREETAELEALEALRDDVAAVESAAATTDELAAARSDLADRLSALDARVSEVDERAASEAGVEELARGVRELDEDTPSLDAFESLEDAHESLASDAARESDVAALRESLSSLEGTLDERRADAVEALEDRIDGERRTREDGFASLSNRVDDLQDRAAEAERVASIEADLDRAYVTEADVTETIETRLQRSLLARTVLVAVGASAGAGVALAATGVTAGVALVVVALAGLAYWWRLQTEELDAA